MLARMTVEHHFTLEVAILQSFKLLNAQPLATTSDPTEI